MMEQIGIRLQNLQEKIKSLSCGKDDFVPKQIEIIYRKEENQNFSNLNNQIENFEDVIKNKTEYNNEFRKFQIAQIRIQEKLRFQISILEKMQKRTEHENKKLALQTKNDNDNKNSKEETLNVKNNDLENNQEKSNDQNEKEFLPYMTIFKSKPLFPNAKNISLLKSIENNLQSKKVQFIPYFTEITSSNKTINNIEIKFLYESQINNKNQEEQTNENPSFPLPDINEEEEFVFNNDSSLLDIELLDISENELSPIKHKTQHTNNSEPSGKKSPSKSDDVFSNFTYSSTFDDTQDIEGFNSRDISDILKDIVYD